jgi:diamine N-acetyltransferase
VRICYRRWELRDVESICQLLHDTWLNTYTPFIPQEDILEYLAEYHNGSAIRTYMENQNIVGFVAEVDETLAGYEKTFFHGEEKRLYVQQLYVLPHYQGAGLGKQLMVFAAEHAATFNLDRVWLGVMTENTKALLWYQNLGYQIVEKTPMAMGKSNVEHYVGYIPVAGINHLNDRKQ